MDPRRWHAAILTMIAAIGVIAILFFSFPARADMSQHSVATGSVYQMQISACTKKEAAIEILKAEQISHEHANKLFDALDECQNFPITFRVGKIVHSAKLESGKVALVVEVEAVKDATIKLYWMTSMTVTASVTKPGEKPSDEIKQPVTTIQRDA